jgi:two-component system, LuxR family, sensor kinase FixL
MKGSARQTVEQARREGEERFRRVVDSAPNAMVMVSAAGQIEMVNTQAERVFGYSRTELLGQAVEMLVPERFRPRHPTLRDAFYANPRARPMGAGRDLYALRKDGSEFPVEIGLNPIETEDGIMVLSAIVDITERKRLEEERQRAEKRVQDIQSELLHVSRLSTMGQMASTLAHELNQPLTAVTNYLLGLRRLLQSGRTDPTRAVEVIDKAVEQAARAGQVIRRLREFVAKGESDRRVESLNQVVEEAVGLAMVGSRQQGVRISVDLDPRTPPVFIDKVQIQQVVLNLVRNAVEALEESDTREVTVSTRSAPGGRSVEMRVIDTGVGLAPDIAERLFEPFLTTKKSGMGLGLSICREIVEAHGGRVSVLANVPAGTVFSVTLPAGHEEEAGHERQPKGVHRR